MVAFVLVALVVSAAATQVSIPALKSKAIQSVPDGRGVIAQMFEWTWDSIADECVSFLGPAGYAFVQTSPPQEHVTGDQWWTDYQPVSYILTSKRGNREQFASMITRCHAAGVKVIADTLFNHMTAMDSGKGTAGSPYSHYDYPGIYQYQDFHHCGLEPGDNIRDYRNRQEVQTCQLDNLADLATDTEYVRARLAAYANDLLFLGVDGMRLDAAKHIAATDLGNITSRFMGKPFITQEVIYGEGEPIQPSEYTTIGDVQEFRYTFLIKDAFTTSGIAGLQNLDDRGWVDSPVANVFVANHDTERNGGGLNYKAANNMYVLATVFSLAHSYGTPTLLSSYDFSDQDAGAPNGGAGTCSTSGGANGWLCQHRWTAFTGMVGFRNVVGKESITNWVAPTEQQIAFGRGSKGFVAINNADTAWTANFTTSLSAGTYCDVIHGTAAPGKCDNPVYTVADDGTFAATVAPRDALALHVGAMPGSTTFHQRRDRYGGEIDVTFSPDSPRSTVSPTPLF
ncbi:glycoside hydrolase family 13 protein [Neolentinus lepideus HHB14362 ss-1]|uniref:Alpha-amylase n=1 Tax=Neolentinus lepideus HHB14362 ss-1 TaxID=1314782 RepID=A0A165MD72_9AGAM|nr:glycoside hydrolase family 13 protein [Neolentinus lepideus HHB14362 ss-1]